MVLKYWQRPSWLGIPASRWLVQVFFVRHAHRSITALKSAIAQRSGAGVDLEAKKQQIEMLDQFDQSLPRNPKPSQIWPAALLVVLVASLVIATFHGDQQSALLEGLARAAVTLDRNAAIDAIARFSKLNHLHWLVAVIAAVVAISAAAGVLLMMLVTPAFKIHRQIRSKLAGVEDRAFTATGARLVEEAQVDLIAWALFIPEIAIEPPVLLWLAWLLTHDPDPYQFWYGWSFAHDPGASHAWGQEFAFALLCIALVLAILTGVACMELRRRYRDRRRPIQPHLKRFRRIYRGIQYLSVPLAAAITIWSITFADRPFFPDTVRLPIAVAEDPPPGTFDYGTVYNGDINFSVTAIEQHAQCTDPHSPWVDNPQYLRFTVEINSDADTFADPAEAHALTLNHWSVLDKDGNFIWGDFYAHPACSHGIDALLEPLSPGRHTVSDIVVTAPTDDVAMLQVEVPSHPAKWRWTIPPAKKQADPRPH